MNKILLDTENDILELVKILSREKMIAFDTEFIRESTFFPKLEILQIATETQTWLVDVPAFFDSLRGLDSLIKVLKDPGILKIGHALQGDQECLYTVFKMVASPVMDTSVAASLLGLGDAVGLGNLLKKVLGVQINKGYSRTNWAQRPLPDVLIEYAKSDVNHLVKLGKALIDQLGESSRREWAMELSRVSENIELYDPDPITIAERLAKSQKGDPKIFPILVELVRWRERRVRELDVPRRRLADDGVLVDIAVAKPKVIDDLRHFRGLNPGEIKRSGAEIISAIEKGRVSDIQRAPLGSRERFERPSAEEERAVSFLKCFIGILADKNNISAKHLIPTDRFIHLIRQPPQTLEQLQRTGYLSESSLKLVGNEIIAFLKGERTLRFSDSRVEVSQ